MNPTQPSDMPRCDDFKQQRDQWRACAEKLFEFGSHAPSCMYRSYLGPPPYPCDCGLNEAREMFEKLKGLK